MSKLADVTAIEVRRTTKAILIETEDEKEVWLPLSEVEVHIENERKRIVIITLPEWLAKKNNLI